MRSGGCSVPEAVGAQWELPGAVARRDQSHVFGFFPIPVRTRAFCRYGGLGSSNRPFLEGVPGVMAQRASLLDQTPLTIQKRRSNRTVYILRSRSRAA
jgi:hypothetical protein